MPKLTSVTSSIISAVGYDSLTEELFVLFHSGDLYRYWGVPQDVYNGLLNATSVGRYFSAYVRDQHSYEIIEDHDLAVA